METDRGVIAVVSNNENSFDCLSFDIEHETNITPIPRGFGSVTPMEHIISEVIENVRIDILESNNFNVSEWRGSCTMTILDSGIMIVKHIIIHSMEQIVNEIGVICRIRGVVQDAPERNNEHVVQDELMRNNEQLEIDARNLKKDKSLGQHLVDEAKDINDIMQVDIDDMEDVCRKLKGVIDGE